MDVIWEPSAEVIERANVTRLLRRLEIDSYEGLLRRSIDEPEWFWRAVVDDLEIEFFTPFDRVLDDSRGPAWSRWFVGGTINLAWNCVHRHAQSERAEADALVFVGEDGERRTMSFASLSSEVGRFAETLVRLGVRQGDRVATYLPPSPQSAIAAYACAHVGAIWMPIFSGFGTPAVAERLSDAQPRVVVTADGTLRRGRLVRMKELVDEALRSVAHVENVIVWERLGLEGTLTQPGRDLTWTDTIAGADGSHPIAHLDSEAPWLLIYTSGTTGRPKGAVHVHGGFLVSVAREVAYHADIGTSDVLHYVSDMGWIMGPWALIGAHARGATVVLAEGAPDWPKPDRVFELIEHERVSVVGVSPTLVRSLRTHGTGLVERHDLSSLRILVSAGEPWNPDPYRWLHQHVGKSRLPIINLSGGTEVGVCFLSPTPVTPIKTCSLGGPMLGMAVDVVDDNGNPVRNTVGELVCRRPWPGITRGFWHDPNRYLDTYWKKIPDVWTHGDWASIDDDGAWYLHGRSDDTLNIAGKRLGPSELESAALAHPAVTEAAAIGIPHKVKGEVAWILCIPIPGTHPTPSLETEVADTISTQLGKAFRPDRIAFVPDLPRTRSQKIVRRALRAAALGLDPGDLTTLENPDSLPAIAATLQDEPQAQRPS